jgi:hypothetical protein
VVLATDDGAADRALGRVVVERDARVVDEADEAIPDAERIGRGLADQFVEAPQEVRRARVDGRNATKGETFVREVLPEIFDLLEGLYEAPQSAELAGVVIAETR